MESGERRTAIPTLIHNTTIVTADDLDRVCQDAAMVIDGAQIAAIGPTPKLLAQYPEAERVNGRDIARTAWRRPFESRPELIPPSGMHILE